MSFAAITFCVASQRVFVVVVVDFVIDSVRKLSDTPSYTEYWAHICYQQHWICDADIGISSLMTTVKGRNPGTSLDSGLFCMPGFHNVLLFLGNL
jgi:hypothetical protein